jgi:uncharacterized protein YjaG (DUF416 family)
MDKGVVTCRINQETFLKFRLKALSEGSDNTAKVNELVCGYLKKPFGVYKRVRDSKETIVGFHINKDLKADFRKEVVSNNNTMQDILVVLIEKYVGVKK